MSMPRSFMTLTASGLSCVGWAPALAASKRSPANWRRNPSAIWLRHEFAVHRNKTRGRFITFFSFQLGLLVPPFTNEQENHMDTRRPSGTDRAASTGQVARSLNPGDSRLRLFRHGVRQT